MFKIEKGDRIFWILVAALVATMSALAITIGYAASVI